jgi:hypothetical protein
MAWAGLAGRGRGRPGGGATDLAGPGAAEAGEAPGRFRRGPTCCVTLWQSSHRQPDPKTQGVLKEV